jgi:hypothetical protein
MLLALLVEIHKREIAALNVPLEVVAAGVSLERELHPLIKRDSSRSR